MSSANQVEPEKQSKCSKHIVQNTTGTVIVKELSDETYCLPFPNTELCVQFLFVQKCYCGLTNQLIAVQHSCVMDAFMLLCQSYGIPFTPMVLLWRSLALSM